ncbi:MAG: SPFH domain-containing protein [Clostridia bacterium]|nr:SPFH domain-containing protein [Clostridia bacterium]
MLLASISNGAIAAIVIAVVAVVAAVTGIILWLVLRNKKFGSGQRVGDVINPQLNNSKLFELVEINKIKPQMVGIVTPTHSAIVISNGSVGGIYTAGEFKLTDSNIKSLYSLKVIYISKTVKLPVNWGTKAHQRFEYVDPKIGKPVSVGAFGVMDIKVYDPSKFYHELVANFGQVFSIIDLQDHIRAKVVDDTVRSISKALRDGNVSYVDFKTAKYDVQSRVKNELSDKFKDYFGFEVCDFIIEDINIPEEQEREIKDIYEEDSFYDREMVRAERRERVKEREYMAERRRKERELDDGDLDDALYNRKTARARGEIEYERKLRHEDEDRAWAREDKLRDSSVGVQEKVIDAYKDVEISRSEALKSVAVTDTVKSAGRHCSVCGAEYKPDAKYCPACGAVIPRENISAKCSSCGTTVAWGTPFCPNCGNKLSK